MKYVLRVLGLPFVIGIQVIWLVWVIILRSYYFLRYGGEMNVYNSSVNRKTIQDVFDKVKLSQDSKVD